MLQEIDCALPFLKLNYVQKDSEEEDEAHDNYPHISLWEGSEIIFPGYFVVLLQSSIIDNEMI